LAKLVVQSVYSWQHVMAYLEIRHAKDV